MYYIIYETTNLINGKYYIGKHKSECLDFDGYLGSGIILSKSIKKYGNENFMRDILFIFTTPQECFLKEKEIVDDKFIKNKNTYNICLGGLGGDIHSQETKSKMNVSKGFTGKKHSIETKAKMSLARKGHKHPLFSKKHSIETKTRMSISKKDMYSGENNPMFGKLGKNNPNYGKKHSEESILKMRGEKTLVKCPHCNKEGGRPVMKRWHFDNCKLKTI